MSTFTEAALLREGGWSGHRRCFDVGQYHIFVWTDVTLRGDAPPPFHVRIWRGPRPVYEVSVEWATKDKKVPTTRDFVDAAMAGMDAAAQKLLIDQPSLEQEMVYDGATGRPAGPMTRYAPAPC